jgi:hypothetical protein
LRDLNREIIGTRLVEARHNSDIAVISSGAGSATARRTAGYGVTAPVSQRATILGKSQLTVVETELRPQSRVVGLNVRNINSQRLAQVLGGDSQKVVIVEQRGIELKITVQSSLAVNNCLGVLSRSQILGDHVQRTNNKIVVEFVGLGTINGNVSVVVQTANLPGSTARGGVSELTLAAPRSLRRHETLTNPSVDGVRYNLGIVEVQPHVNTDRLVGESSSNIVVTIARPNNMIH